MLDPLFKVSHHGILKREKIIPRSALDGDQCLIFNPETHKTSSSF